MNNNIEKVNIMLLNYATLNGIEFKKIYTNYSFKKNKQIEFKIVLDLINHDYVKFLTDKYYNIFSRVLLKYFSKYNILYLNYKDKDKILYNLNIFNKFINNISDNYLNNIDTIFEKRIKYLNFTDNLIEPNLLYKKISFAKEEIFLSFELYSVKKIEYKLRTFCQIAEKLGAEKIKIKYNLKYRTNTKVNFGIDSIFNGISGKINKVIKDENSIELNFNYTNHIYNLNLNKHYLIKLIEEENEFFIKKDDFYTDIDLKFLLDSRCINLINEYHTNIIINQMNSLERNLSLKAKSIGLNIGISEEMDLVNSVNIDIIFLNIYDHPESIDGYNLYHMKEGFWHLTNIIKTQLKYNKNKIDKKPLLEIVKKENGDKELFYGMSTKEIYFKINNFLLSNLRYTKNYNINLDILPNIIMDDLIKNYTIIKKSFNHNELEEIYYKFFENNLFYNRFEEFKNIFIKPNKYFDIFLYDPFDTKVMVLLKEKEKIIKDILNNDPLTKLYFISLQYHLILKYKVNLFNKILIYLKSIYLTDNNNSNNIIDIENYKFKKYFEIIFEILDKIFDKSFELNCFQIRSYNGFMKVVIKEIEKKKLDNKIIEIFENILIFLKKNKLFIYNTNEFYDVYPIKDIIYSITNEYLLNINKSLKDNDKHTNKFLHDNIQDTNYTHYKIFCTLEDLKSLLLEKNNIAIQ
jgi:hypothetical protein